MSSQELIVFLKAMLENLENNDPYLKGYCDALELVLSKVENANK